VDIIRETGYILIYGALAESVLQEPLSTSFKEERKDKKT
jgi:hypothetical protein